MDTNTILLNWKKIDRRGFVRLSGIFLVIAGFSGIIEGCGGGSGGGAGVGESQQIRLTTTITGQGSVQLTPPGGIYDAGSTVTLSAISDAGWQFMGWSGDIVSTSNPLNVTMDADKSIDALFEISATPVIISDINAESTENTAIITFTTDDLSIGAIDYGETTSYELGRLEEQQEVYNHSIMLSILTPGTLYHYRITVKNTQGQETVTNDYSILTKEALTNAPHIDVWYGQNQSFGQLGLPQRWVNILGNVSDLDGSIVSLTYVLNDGSELPLTIGPDGYRLVNEGDFNIEISNDDLLVGNNHIIIRATDDSGNTSIENVNISFENSNYWPEQYTINWNSVANIQDAAQVVDGHWEIQGDSVRSIEPGYDRLIAIGDVSWGDYEITVPITVHSIDYVGYNPSAVGVLLRWQGHTADGNQPSTQWWPLGSIGWYRWYSGSGYFEFYDKSYREADTSGLGFSIGTTYIYKLRVESVVDSATGEQKSEYKFKTWPIQSQEPNDWLITKEEFISQDLANGSILLISHMADASFGPITIKPIT